MLLAGSTEDIRKEPKKTTNRVLLGDTINWSRKKYWWTEMRSRKYCSGKRCRFLPSEAEKYISIFASLRVVRGIRQSEH